MIERRLLVPEEGTDLDRATRRKRQFLGDRDCSVEVRDVNSLKTCERGRLRQAPQKFSARKRIAF